MPRFSLQAGLAVAGFVFIAAATKPAAAEVVLVKADGWKVATSGRANAFFSYAFGDTNPVAHPGENIPLGAGLNTGNFGNPGGMNADGTLKQGKFSTMRMRSGFVPNVLSLNISHQVNDAVTLDIQTTLWATIETENLRKTTPPTTYLQEGFARLKGPLGTIIAGRSLDLFSRGATEADFMYGHGYGLGWGGQIDNYGPANGLIGFGVIASFFAPGIVYATPSLGGLQLTAGVYDPAPLPGGYEKVSSARPEAELTYDLAAGSFKMHLFANGEYQKVYKQSSEDSATSMGVGYGGRFEVGPVHLAAVGHYGKGLGLHYALESSAVSVSQNFELRSFDGYAVMAQYVIGNVVDLNAGYGISRVFMLDSDKADPTIGLPRNEQGYYAGIVYHYTPNYHVDLDYFRGHTEWRFGQKQDVNFVNFGLTATW
ncbi:MAG TPA: porin [Polyangiaceae bacterium]|nr:porin [Polyangiaceae bacterium]